MCGFFNVWVCVCVGFVCVSVCMCGFCGVCKGGFCDVWVCLSVGFVMCDCVYVWVL